MGVALLLPNAMGLSKTYTGSFAAGFVVYAVLAACVLLVLQVVQKKWVGTWIGKGGRSSVAIQPEAVRSSAA